MPITESKSLRKPLGIFSEGDYYHFKRFETQLSDHLKQHANDPSHDAADVRMLLTEHFRFSSKCEAGLELVDVLTNATRRALRSEEHTSELQSLMRISYAVFCLKKKNNKHITNVTER